MIRPAFPCTAEEAIRWYRSQPGHEAAARANYFDLPVLPAAERYAGSEEFAEIRRLLGSGKNRRILDLGAGNGIASFALARDGWKVTALEPDPSAEIGAGAIRAWQRDTGLPVEIEERAEASLPFPTGHFEAAFIRQVLHHLPSLPLAFRELFRVLKPGGTLLAIREHVASDQAELRAFLAAHPLHPLHGKEHAFPLETYLDAARGAGFIVAGVLGQAETILNYHPGTEAERLKMLRKRARRRLWGLGRLLAGSSAFLRDTARRLAREDRSPGRLYSFLLRKPA